MGSVVGYALIARSRRGSRKSGGTERRRWRTGFARAAFDTPFGRGDVPRDRPPESTLGTFVGKTALEGRARRDGGLALRRRGQVPAAGRRGAEDAARRRLNGEVGFFVVQFLTGCPRLVAVPGRRRADGDLRRHPRGEFRAWQPVTCSAPISAGACLPGCRATRLGSRSACSARRWRSALIGVVLEVALLRRIYRAPELFQLLATFGVVLIVQDVTLRDLGAERSVAAAPAVAARAS